MRAIPHILRLPLNELSASKWSFGGSLFSLEVIVYGSVVKGSRRSDLRCIVRVQ